MLWRDLGNSFGNRSGLVSERPAAKRYDHAESVRPTEHFPRLAEFRKSPRWCLSRAAGYLCGLYSFARRQGVKQMGALFVFLATLGGSVPCGRRICWGSAAAPKERQDRLQGNRSCIIFDKSLLRRRQKSGWSAGYEQDDDAAVFLFSRCA